jgi:hypothetical protein
LAQLAAVLLLVLVVLLSVPEIRAQVIAFLRIGAVQIELTTATPIAAFQPNGDLPSSLLNFPGETTLDDAQQQFGQPIPLPPMLGAPDRVYLINAYQPIVVLVWLDDRGRVDVSLHLLPEGAYALKTYDGPLEETEVNGERAVWLPNPHWYVLRTGSGSDDAQIRFVHAHALVWETPDLSMTYRLETEGTLEEALDLAESISAGNG